jgi:hypothetical protein
MSFLARLQAITPIEGVLLSFFLVCLFLAWFFSEPGQQVGKAE